MVEFLQVIIGGLGIGAVYAIVALGFAILIKSANVLNLAQGELVMLGAFGMYTLINVLHLPFSLSFIIIALGGILMGLVLERFIHRPFADHTDLHVIMIATLSLSVIIKNAALKIWGPYPLALSEPLGNKVFKVASVTIYGQYIFIILVVIIILALIMFLFKSTALGKMMLAISENREAAIIIGIKASLISKVTFALAAVMGATGGVLLAPVFGLETNMGTSVGLKAFIACIIGGWGSMNGAILGALMIGLVEALTTYFLSSLYKDVIVFCVLIAFLIVLPNGLSRQKIVEKV